MFVHNLNSDQQSALLYLARVVAEADGNSDELQTGMVEILKAQSNADVEMKEIQISELATLFSTAREKCSLLLELLGIVLANNEYHHNERSLIAEYADVLGVSNTKLFELENWVQRQLALSQEAEVLLNYEIKLCLYRLF